MANSRFEYVKRFEVPDELLLNTWIVVRIDGRGFTKLCDKYGWEKPNDARALNLMNAAAKAVMAELPDITVAYGVSDEYSFVFHKNCSLFDRRAGKLVSTVVSTFTAYYVHLWPQMFGSGEGDGATTPALSPPLPSFDGRAVCYPSVQNLRDYMSWRQADCHINNLYNTTFWGLIQGGPLLTHTAAEELLSGTVSADKHEILFKQLGINYNNEPEMYKKGSVAFRDYVLVEPSHANTGKEEPESTGEPAPQSKTQQEKDRKRRAKARIVVEHLDIIKDDFWDRRPWLLSNKPGQIPKQT